MKRVRISNLDCISCVNFISSKLEEEGGRLVNFDLNKRELTAIYEQGKFSGNLVSFLNSLGYEARYFSESGGGVSDSTDNENCSASSFSVGLAVFLTLPLYLNHLFHLYHFLTYDILASAVVLVIGLREFGKGAWTSAVNFVKTRSFAALRMEVLILLGVLTSYIYAVITCFSGMSHFETPAAIITFMMLGEATERYYLRKATGSLSTLATSFQYDIKEVVNEFTNLGNVQVEARDAITVGACYLVKEGDAIPCDGIIRCGEAEVIEAELTGESEPVYVGPGREVFASTQVASGALVIEAVAAGENTFVAKVQSLAESASFERPRIQRLGDKVAGIFVPVVVGISLATFLVYLIFGFSLGSAALASLSVIVISCPCAVGLATPLAVSQGLRLASKLNILVKDTDAFERLAKIRLIAFDKTNTLTSGDFVIEPQLAAGIAEAKFASVIKSLESHSSHPIARSLCHHFRAAEMVEISKVKSIPGYGITGSFADTEYYIGRPDHSGALAGQANSESGEDLGIVVLENGQRLGSIFIKESLKAETRGVIEKLRGYELMIISGDSEARVKSVAEDLEITDAHAEVLPQKKAELLQLRQQQKTLYVGDGSNDIISLASASVGVALGDRNFLTATKAHIVIPSGNLNKIVDLLSLGKITYKTIVQNYCWAIGYNLIFIPLAAFGIFAPSTAALLMAFSDIILIVNCLRMSASSPSQS